MGLHVMPLAVVMAMTMAVPCPAGGNDEVARLHQCAFAVHSGVGTVSFDHKAQGALRVPVTWRYLTRQNNLQPGIQRLRDARLAPQSRVLKHQHAPHSFLSGDELAGRH